MTTVADLWKMILEDMREDISSIALSTWFDEVVPVRTENGQMHLYCPNSFKKKYHSTVLSADGGKVFDETIFCAL